MARNTKQFQQVQNNPGYSAQHEDNMRNAKVAARGGTHVWLPQGIRGLARAHGVAVRRNDDRRRLSVSRTAVYPGPLNRSRARWLHLPKSVW